MNNSALSETQLKEAAPSIFASRAHRSRSKRYAFVPTSDVVNRLRKAGYVVTAASQSNHRAGNEDRNGFAKHMLRLRHRDLLDLTRKNVGDVIPEIVLLNSHNGSSSFRMEGGLFRLACSNGLIVKSQSIESIILNHTGEELLTEVSAAADSISKRLPELMRVTKDWDKIVMNAAARTRFANKALALRYGDNPSPVTAADILAPQRNEDEAPTLWRTFNVIQENLARGGIEGVSPTGRSVRVRSIQSVNNLLHFNRGLWEMAEKIAAA